MIPKGVNIVLLANKHNPSIISKDWVINNHILNGEIVNFAHLPVASIVEDMDYNLFIDQDSLRLTVKNINEENIENSSQIIINYVNKLPETPYNAIGFNFLYSLNEDERKLRDIFIADEDKVTKIFAENYSFGGIIKFKFEDFVVTAKIAPENGKEVKVDFNFHYKSNNVRDILFILKKHLDALERSKEILRELFNSDR